MVSESRIVARYAETDQMGIVHHSVYQAARYEDELMVRARVEKMSPARIRFAYEVYRQGESKPINTGATAHGFVDSATFAPINLKKRNPDLFALLQSSMEG